MKKALFLTILFALACSLAIAFSFAQDTTEDIPAEDTPVEAVPDEIEPIEAVLTEDIVQTQDVTAQIMTETAQTQAVTAQTQAATAQAQAAAAQAQAAAAQTQAAAALTQAATALSQAAAAQTQTAAPAGTAATELISTHAAPADEVPEVYLFIEGSAEVQSHLEFFTRNFSIEAGGAGFSLVQTKEEAAYTFKFHSAVNHDKCFDYNDYVLRISLINNSSNEEILNFDFFFTNLNEMQEHTQYLFHQATVYILPGREVFAEIDRSWQNKWLYLRASVGFQVAIYNAQQYSINVPQPGITLGAEVQFLDFMSFELNFQLDLGSPYTQYNFINMAVGAEIKYSFKTNNYIFQPYGTFLYPVGRSASAFEHFPLLTVGAGVQAGLKGFGNGSFFLDVKFLYSIDDAEIKNNDNKIDNYRRFVFGIGAGYKFGLFNRR